MYSSKARGACGRALSAPHNPQKGCEPGRRRVRRCRPLYFFQLFESQNFILLRSHMKSMVTRAASVGTIDNNAFTARAYNRANRMDRVYLRTVIPVYFTGKLAALSALLFLVSSAVLLSHGLAKILLQICLGAVFA